MFCEYMRCHSAPGPNESRVDVSSQFRAGQMATLCVYRSHSIKAKSSNPVTVLLPSTGPRLPTSFNLKSFRHATSSLSTSPNLDPSSQTPQLVLSHSGIASRATHLSVYLWQHFKKSWHTPITPTLLFGGLWSVTAALQCTSPTAFVLCPTV
jgi:hypothetical protein